MRSKPLPVTRTPEKSHSDQFKWHILLPILSTTLVCVVVCLILLITSTGEAGSTRLWSDISIIFLMLNGILAGMIILLVIWLLSKLFAKWNQNLPIPIRNFREKTLLFNHKVRKAVQPPAKAIIGIKGLATGIKTFFSR